MSDQKNLTLLSGRCLCGAVHYTVKNAFLYSLICHCQDCRRATGSAFKPFAGIERDRLEITQGDNHLLRYGDETNQDILMHLLRLRSLDISQPRSCTRLPFELFDVGRLALPHRLTLKYRST